jgi:hypothetical protein
LRRQEEAGAGNCILCILNKTIPEGSSGRRIRRKPRGGANATIVRRIFWIRNGDSNWPLRESKVQIEESPARCGWGLFYLDGILHHLVGLLDQGFASGSTGSGPLEDHQQIRADGKEIRDLQLALVSWDPLRGCMDASQYKDHVLVPLFVK